MKVLDVTTPGRWYDPISERWIEPRDTRTATPPRAEDDAVFERQRTLQIERIWRALVDCCARE
ncbi:MULTISPECIES: hypothetical protein [Bradyrhizobium]|uniref:Uncharacterized protein n=1 Tax=Bradyrhizobium zhanjiangense TaxID=1325107 RepID=A0A4Q0S7N6_9BRAD|nr:MULTISPECIES: hypothetical protein [Bradyrhizobium]RXG87114.1 hypothetical protein EAS61_32060 [Bradyrhizobium zhanjiangense]RXG89353.1 hypothetical protein EAS62_30520 [Bradyrhizobium zhanjiangense]RXH32718.1 hypothetical protein XH94_31335 [Bradyrhizobium zhanjiangense]UQR67024.1 hypothetical protein LRP30_17980 [Bradyrhizobium sp. C-145]